MTDTIFDPLIWARSVGLDEIAQRFPADVEAAWRDARRDLDDLPPEPPPLPEAAAAAGAKS